MNYISHKSPTILPPRPEPTMPTIGSMDEDDLREAMMRDGASKYRALPPSLGKTRHGNAKTGLSARCREALREHGNMTSREVAAILGDVTVDRVSSALSGMVFSAGGVWVVRKEGRVNVWGLVE